VCLDAGYCIAAVAGPLADTPVQVVLRLRHTSVLYTDPPPPPPGRGGRPRRHGHRIKLCDPSSWPEPDQTATVAASPDGTRPGLSVAVWHRVHPAPSEAVHEPGNDRTRNTNRRLIHGHLIRLRSAEPAGPDRWLWWSGPADSFDRHRVVAAYLRRFGIEHFFRFIKQDLAWTLPRVRHPEQADRWSWVVAAGYAQLALARSLVGSDTPWDRRGRQTPGRVKRGFARLQWLIGSPAKPPQPAKPGPGRPKGRRNRVKHPHHPVVKKANR
jgi:DDE superfamily endonuclease